MNLLKCDVCKLVIPNNKDNYIIKISKIDKESDHIGITLHLWGKTLDFCKSCYEKLYAMKDLVKE